MCLSEFWWKWLTKRDLAIYWWSDLFPSEEEFAKALFWEDEEAIEKYLKENEKYREKLEKNVKNQKEFPLELTIINNEIVEKFSVILKNFCI